LGSNELTIIAPIAAIFIVFINIRLFYIDKQFDELLPKFKTKLDEADKQLQSEIAKQKPDKSQVLSFANLMATYTSIRNEIKDMSKSNRTQILLDVMTVGSVILVGFANLDQSPLFEYLNVLFVISLTAGFFSGLSFFVKLHSVNIYKNKSIDLDN